jgi:hypothetical protein
MVVAALGTALSDDGVREQRIPVDQFVEIISLGEG